MTAVDPSEIFKIEVVGVVAFVIAHVLVLLIPLNPPVVKAVDPETVIVPFAKFKAQLFSNVLFASDFKIKVGVLKIVALEEAPIVRVVVTSSVAGVMSDPIVTLVPTSTVPTPEKAAEKAVFEMWLTTTVERKSVKVELTDTVPPEASKVKAPNRDPDDPTVAATVTVCAPM